MSNGSIFTYSSVDIDTLSHQPVVDTSVTSNTSNPHSDSSSATHHHKIQKISAIQPHQHPMKLSYLNMLSQQQRQLTMSSIKPSNPYSDPHQKPIPINYDQYHHASSGSASSSRPYSNIISEVSLAVIVGSETREKKINATKENEALDKVVRSPQKFSQDNVKVRCGANNASSDTQILKKRLATNYYGSEKKHSIIQQSDATKERSDPTANNVGNDIFDANIDTLPQPSFSLKLKKEHHSATPLDIFSERCTSPDKCTTHHPTELPSTAPSMPQHSSRYSSFVQDGISRVPRGIAPTELTTMDLKSPTRLKRTVVTMSSSNKDIFKLQTKLRPAFNGTTYIQPNSSSTDDVITPIEKAKTTVICPKIKKCPHNIYISSPTMSPKVNPSKQDICANHEKEIPLSNHYTHNTLSPSTTSVTSSSIMATTATATTMRTTPQKQGRYQSQQRNKRKKGNDYRSIIWTYYTPEVAVENCPEIDLDLSLLPPHRQPK